MPEPRRIWITRSQPQAAETADRLRAMGLEAVVAPVLAMRPLADVMIDPAGADAVAFTSGHAVQAFATLWSLAQGPVRDLPVFTVGEATASKARAAGFTDVRASSGDVRALAQTIAEAKPVPKLVLNPTASEPAANLEDLLAVHGVRARRIAVYETVAAGPFAVPDDIDTVLIHSAKAANLVAGLVGPGRASGLSIFAISAAAAAPLQFLSFARFATAPFPDEASLLDLLKG